MNLPAAREKRRSSRGQALSENHGEKHPEGLKGPNGRPLKEDLVAVDSRRTSRRGSMNVANSTVEQTSITKRMSSQAATNSPEDVGSAGKTSSPAQTTARMHRTRNKKPKISEKPTAAEEIHETSIFAKTQVKDEETAYVASAKPKLSLNGCANVLATLDSRSYHRALVQDANRVAERILLPMSLPWTHKVAPVARNIPCDIDEMIDIITLDDGSFTPFENGNFGFGQFDTGQQRLGESAVLLANSSGMLRSAARRSTDPGVIELATVSLPFPLAKEATIVSESFPAAVPSLWEDEQLAEEFLLNHFEMTQAKKKRKVLRTRKALKSYTISVKVNGSSSRSSLFDGELSEAQSFNGLLSSGFLAAIMPLEVEVGRKLKKAKAREIAAMIGSYNVRQAPDLVDEVGKSKRTNVGRTRLMWTKKVFSEQHQRVSFNSLLTDEKMELGSHKRPREVLFRMIVGGLPFNGRDEDDLEILATSNEDPPNFVTPFQATLHPDKRVCNLLNEVRPRGDSHKADAIPPKMECATDSCGVIHTVCISSGKFSLASVSRLLNSHAKRANERRCTVCWTATAGGSVVMECGECGLLAHPSCCLDSGQSSFAHSENDEPSWKCAVCCHVDESGSAGSSEGHTTKKSKRKAKLPSRFNDSEMVVESIAHPKSEDNDNQTEKQCALCLLFGGAMSLTKVGEASEWVHEACRIWTKVNFLNKIGWTVQNTECALCGSTGGGTCHGVEPFDSKAHFRIAPKRCVVKCAAAGCQVSVHPMCALISSITAQSLDTSSEEIDSAVPSIAVIGTKYDYSLCDQYTLTFASMTGTTNAFGRDPGNERQAMLPVFFCGIHNPKRENCYYGLPPGGKNLSSPLQALTIPGCREPEATM